jgi:hypothetical protein
MDHRRASLRLSRPSMTLVAIGRHVPTRIPRPYGSGSSPSGAWPVDQTREGAADQGVPRAPRAIQSAIVRPMRVTNQAHARGAGAESVGTRAERGVISVADRVLRPGRQGRDDQGPTPPRDDERGLPGAQAAIATGTRGRAG